MAWYIKDIERTRYTKVENDMATANTLQSKIKQTLANNFSQKFSVKTKGGTVIISYKDGLSKKAVHEVLRPLYGHDYILEREFTYDFALKIADYLLNNKIGIHEDFVDAKQYVAGSDSIGWGFKSHGERVGLTPLHHVMYMMSGDIDPKDIGL